MCCAWKRLEIFLFSRLLTHLSPPLPHPLKLQPSSMPPNLDPFRSTRLPGPPGCGQAARPVQSSPLQFGTVGYGPVQSSPDRIGIGAAGSPPAVPMPIRTGLCVDGFELGIRTGLCLGSVGYPSICPNPSITAPPLGHPTAAPAPPEAPTAPTPPAPSARQSPTPRAPSSHAAAGPRRTDTSGRTAARAR